MNFPNSWVGGAISKSILIIGSSGLLGQALGSEATRLGWDVSTVARSNAKLICDITDPKQLARIDLSPYEIVVNAAALTDLKACEENPELALNTNALPAKSLAEGSRSAGAFFVQISTDHYFSGDGRAKHDESAPVAIFNEYARSKRQGEIEALKNPDALVVRTNIVGWRGWEGKPTFLEWVHAQLESGAAFTAFDDFFTSSIDVTQFSRALLSLASLPEAGRPRGILNLASSEVASKREFIEAFARKNRYDLRAMIKGSIKDLAGPRRAESLGLDVSKAESLLGYRLPALNQVVGNLWEDFRNKSYAVRR